MNGRYTQEEGTHPGQRSDGGGKSREGKAAIGKTLANQNAKNRSGKGDDGKSWEMN